ncbi:hypothetical protein R1flu_024157 [Riccia fluitans]|uniref:RRM domain-containing protein n=1 Tax=Riccia fluitans TaxID=41844 RepID=A0ABD1XU41_9MARC
MLLRYTVLLTDELVRAEWTEVLFSAVSSNARRWTISRLTGVSHVSECEALTGRKEQHDDHEDAKNGERICRMRLAAMNGQIYDYVKDAAALVTEFSKKVAPDSSTSEIEGDVKGEVVMEAKEGKKGSESEIRVAGNGRGEHTNVDGAEEEYLPSEADSVDVPSYWHANPCVHIIGLGGVITEEDLMPLLNPHGSIVSFVFENDRKETAIVRYERSDSTDEEVVGRVRSALSNTRIKDKMLTVEPFRSDSLLFIGNLTPEIDDVVLRQMFGPHGTVERAFVVRNAKGRSKGYGFVEYSLKSQANAAKVAMGNINMDGRVLRVEWSDCRRVVDMFSTVLFVDRINKDRPNIQQTLKNLFSQYGKVRDCQMAIGMNQQFRGFAFIDFYHSISADEAHEALDGREVEGSNIRVSFANPSKTAQSYKSRFGNQTVQVVATFAGRGSFPDHMVRPAMVGASMRGHMAIPLMGNRFLGQAHSNLMGMGIGMQFGRGAPVGPGMIGRNLVPPFLGAGAAMLGPGTAAASMIGRGPGMIVANVQPRVGMPGSFGPLVSRFPSRRGPTPINPAAIAQVATAQAKAREEEAKARAEAQAKLSQAGSRQNAAEQERLEQFRRLAAQQAQLAPVHTATPMQQPSQTYYSQRPPSVGLDQHYKEADTTSSYHPQQSAQQQHAPPAQPHQQPYQATIQQVASGQQTRPPFASQYYSQPAQQYSQVQPSQSQPQQAQKDSQTKVASLLPQQPLQPPRSQQTQIVADQYSQQQVYYQQHVQAPAKAVVANQQQYVQYGQQYLQQQQSDVQYNQTYAQVVQPYSQPSQQQIPAQSTQQDFGDYYAQHQTAGQEAQGVTAASETVSATAVALQPQDLSQHQQAYEAYYQQRAQEAVAQTGTTAIQSATAAASPQQNLEAQWAAYYAAQSALEQAGTPSAYDQQQSAYVQQPQGYAATGSAGYYQQPAAVEVGHKRTADQIDYSTQAQASYAHPQQSAAAVPDYSQQVINGVTPFQQPSATGSAVYQQPVSTVSSYQQPAASAYQQQLGAGVAAYVQQQTSVPGYTLTAAGGYQQVGVLPASVYQQQVPPVSNGYQQTPAPVVQGYLQPNQTAVPPVQFDYSKRPRY